MRLKEMLRFLIAGAAGGLLGWLISEPFQDNVSYWADFFSLYMVALCLTIALSVEKFIYFKKWDRVLPQLKFWPIYVIPLVAVLFIKTLFASKGEGGLLDKATENRVLLLDVSSSMDGQAIRELRRAAGSYLEELEEMQSEDQVACITFEDQPHMLSPLTRDYNSLKEKISTLEADGGTDMVNALQSAYEFLNQNGGPGPKDIILVADGQDRYIEVYEPLISANDDIPIYVVGVGDEYDEGLLRAIASQSGGDFFAANNINRLVAVFGEIVRRQGLTQTDASTESSISAGKRIIGWAVFGLMIGLTIGIIDRNKEKVIIGLAGGFAGGALSAILFLGIGQLQVSEGALARGLSFFILGLLLGGALYLVQFSYNKMFKSRDLLDLEKLKQ